MSIWTSFVGGISKVTPRSYELVVSSLKVVPTARTTSASFVSELATELPTFPGWKPQSGLSAGKPPFASPLKEQTTGAPRNSATATTSSPAPDSGAGDDGASATGDSGRSARPFCPPRKCRNPRAKPSRLSSACLHRTDHRLQRARGGGLGNIGVFGDVLDQFGLVHGAPRRENC